MASSSSVEYPLLEFGADYVRVCVYIPKKDVKRLKREYGKVTGVQPPLIGSYKNGLSIYLPWIQKEE